MSDRNRPLLRRDRFSDLRRIRRRRTVGVAFKGLVIVAACAVLVLRFTDFRTSPTVDRPELAGQPAKFCETFVDQGCRCTETWADPWPGAAQPVAWWLPSRQWCIGRGSGPLRNFPAVLPGSFFEKQMRDRKSLATELITQLIPELDVPPGEGELLFLFDNRAKPYDTFPHIYPVPTMWANTGIFVAIVWFYIRIVWLSLPIRVGREENGPKQILILWSRYRRQRRWRASRPP